jgi:poly-gamma-glutamate capsule biosynthesis protein CapA/YwtB (metallophosphatase superfamily)
MVRYRKVSGVLVPVAAALAVASLSGCFDGTVRSPTSASRQSPRGQNEHGPEKPGQEKPQRSQVDDEVPPAREEPGGITIAAVGDTMLGNTPDLPPEPSTYLDPVKQALAGDVVFGNLEGALSEVAESPKCEGAKPGECYAFRAPPEYADHLAEAGFTVMSNANNHALDFGETGLEETVDALHEAGIEQTGLPGEVTTVEADGRRLAFLGFAPYPWAAPLTDLETARALIEDAAAEADIVVVAIHAGAEGSDAGHVGGAEETYLGEDRGNPEEFAHLAIDAGADLVLGSGPHVLRGIEVYDGRLVAYSLGNFSGFHNFATEGVLGASAILHVTLAPDGAFRGGRLDSLRLVEAGQPVPDPRGEAATLIAQLSAEDFGNSAIQVGNGGTLTAP